MNIEYARTIRLRDVLDKMGFQPIEEKNHRLLYKSFVSADPAAALCVTPESNKWYDEDKQIGGDVIALVCCYLKTTEENYTVKDALRWLKNMFRPALSVPHLVKDFSEADSKYQIVGDDYLNKPFLIHYLEKKRRIPFDLARFVLKQYLVRNNETGKHLYALGLENEDGGVSVRSPVVKANIGVQAIKFVRGEPKPPRVHIFKDAMDYLSILTHRQGRRFDDDVIILNGYMGMKDSSGYILNYGYETAYTWFDNGEIGIAVTKSYSRFFDEQQDLKHIPRNSVFRPYHDPNSWLAAGPKV